MTTIYIRERDGYVADFLVFDPGVPGYVPLAVSEVPADLACGCYRMADGVLRLDAGRLAAAEEERREVVRLRNENKMLRAEIDRLAAGA